jgi:hypothetical protein
VIEGVEGVGTKLQAVFFTPQRKVLGDAQIHVDEMRAA